MIVMSFSDFKSCYLIVEKCLIYFDSIWLIWLKFTNYLKSETRLAVLLLFHTCQKFKSEGLLSCKSRV